ncbi:MAG: hypothetical protein ABIP37_00845, partial [Methylotenera sp.]
MRQVIKTNRIFKYCLSILLFIIFSSGLAQNLCHSSLDHCNELIINTIRGTVPTFNLVKHTSIQEDLSLSKDKKIVIAKNDGAEPINSSKWSKNILDWQTAPIDLSFLNKSERPAGKRGFVKAKGDQLIFEDGTVAKFWGTNIAAYTLFETPKALVQAQAKRLSALGFNLVRLHHHDSLWVNPNIFGSQKLNSTKVINDNAIEKIDWWIKCLKDEGIYVWLDLHVGRSIKSGDGITAFDEISKGEPSATINGYNYVNQSIQNSMRDFNAAYLNHINKYTHTKYVDEPAIAAVLITNENDITHHYGNALLPDKNVPYHSKIFMSKAEAFAIKNGLAVDKIARTWEHGPSKLFLN